MMQMDYVTGRIGKIVFKALPSTMTIVLASCAAYGVYTGNIDVAKEIGRTAAIMGGIGAGAVASVIDLYENW